MQAAAHTSLIAVEAMTWLRALLKIRPSGATAKLAIYAQDLHQLRRDGHTAGLLCRPVL
jgi:hypothetical protein